jgi:hypothetical protein
VPKCLEVTPAEPGLSQFAIYQPCRANVVFLQELHHVAGWDCVCNHKPKNPVPLEMLLRVAILVVEQLTERQPKLMLRVASDSFGLYEENLALRDNGEIVVMFFEFNTVPEELAKTV